MKYNNNNTLLPVNGQASGLNQGSNKTKKKNRKKNIKKNIETTPLQKSINDEKNAEKSNEIDDHENIILVSSEAVVRNKESFLNNEKIMNNTDILHSSFSNGSRINSTDNASAKNSDTSELSSLSVSPANSIIDDNVKSLDIVCDVLSSTNNDSRSYSEEISIVEKIEKMQFPSPSKVREFIPRSHHEPINFETTDKSQRDMDDIDHDKDTDVSPNESSASLPESSDDSQDSGVGPSVLQDKLQDFACDDNESNSQDTETIYSFEIIGHLVGRLIGKRGKFVNSILDQTGASVIVVAHPRSSDDKICNIHGTSSQVSAALDIINERFSSDRFSGFSTERYTFPPEIVHYPENFKLSLPIGMPCSIQVYKIMDPSHFYVHAVTHPSYFTMWKHLDDMNEFYNENSPKLEFPQLGNICVIKADIGWCRAEIVALLSETDRCMVRICDFGGYEYVENTSLYLMNANFMDYPFQAIECCLGGIQPIDGNNWTEEATRAFERIVGGVINGTALSCTDKNAFCMRLFRDAAEYGVIFVDKYLVENGLARWI
ncbi:a-kinase anchor protein 1, mitochondrial [Nephila pilipes]|uniref:A-kinase anchor protein 1, mitochondrial n=1 Tax=Nephila pilipes TaxID=299642 RepID=A0A8X6NJH9_NEPPI|nr:a-kinase anchor protein 1, mitochondrial [Nephila pilipes]